MPRVIAAIVRDDDLRTRRDAIVNEMLARQSGDRRNAGGAPTQEWQDCAVGPSKEHAIALRHEACVKIVDADDMTRYRHGSQIAETQQAALHMCWQLQL